MKIWPWQRRTVHIIGFFVCSYKSMSLLHHYKTDAEQKSFVEKKKMDQEYHISWHFSGQFLYIGII